MGWASKKEELLEELLWKEVKKEIELKSSLGFSTDYFYEHRLSSKELDNLPPIKKNPCGYLRVPKIYCEKITGVCALSDSFERCNNPSKDCPILTKFYEGLEYQHQLGLAIEEMKQLGVVIE